jgi:hypothetical protein
MYLCTNLEFYYDLFLILDISKTRENSHRLNVGQKNEPYPFGQWLSERVLVSATQPI